MRIGFICDQETCLSGKSNGIRMQALIWKAALEQNGFVVDLISPWGDYNWATFDIIHIFSFADSISIVEELHRRGCKIVISPIIDTIQSKWKYRLFSHWGSKKLRLSSTAFYLRSKKEYFDLFYARSRYEAEYIHYCFDVPYTKILTIPLSYRSEFHAINFSKKENFCLHVSSITQNRKNVMRLIKAAIKYNFNLVLAGSKGSPEAYAPFAELISGHDNIKVLGFVSDTDLTNLYNRAKVFALPSINEGVGLVALEAAVHGCGIVITTIGGPKEYFPSDMSYHVNPFSIDDIGLAVKRAFDNPHQPTLCDYIAERFGIDETIKSLIASYNNLVKDK